VLGQAVSEGRRREFARFPQFQDPELRALIPDPNADGTFEASRLDWNARERAPHRHMLDWYRHLLAIRRQHIVPLLSAMPPRGGRYKVFGDGTLQVIWGVGIGELTLAANLSAAAAAVFPAATTGATLCALGDIGDIGADGAGPWSVRWSLERS
jgi:1,4-alpha-glucan branching enzyme